ncbi:MAG: alpha/beta hydrolase, partial [Alphaproteobacteria bacterium]|nr:alpha/beta hydrolase [Alphaproteobacteria bacterium]
METVVLDTNGVRLHCLAWGAEDAPLAVLVHGFPDTPYTWDLVGPRVAEAGYRVLAPFTRGIGPSTDTDPPDYGSDTLGADLIGLIDALGREQAVLVGHDFGASAVYSATGNHPGRVAKMVTVA